MWSSQLYKKEGLEKGLSEALLEAAIAQSEEIIYSENKIPAILSLNHLACRTGIEYSLLRGFVARRRMDGEDEIEIYEKFSIRKRSGGRRFIHVPEPRLMHAQKWINRNILKNLPVHSSSQAFNEGSSIRKCASRHCGARWLIKIDLADFFDSISEVQVYRVFRSAGYQPLVAFELSRLCTVDTYFKSPRKRFSQWQVRKPNTAIPSYSRKLLGYLPQGAPTSPLLANLVMKDCDASISMLSRKFGLIYSRYSDDMNFSTRSKNFNREKARDFIFEVYKIVSKFGFRARLRKTTVIPPGGKKVVLGLDVSNEVPRLTKNAKEKIEQHLYYLEKFGAAEHTLNRKFDSIFGLKSHLKGLIDFARMVEREYGNKLLERYNKIDWPV